MSYATTTTTVEEESVLAVYNTFGQVMWTFLVLFAWILFFWLLFAVFGDLFRRHDLSGWGKAAWSIFVIFVPFLGCFVYLITQGHKIGERNIQEAQAAQAQLDSHIKSVAGSGSAEQIAKAKELLDSGAITQVEFDALKAKALA